MGLGEASPTAKHQSDAIFVSRVDGLQDFGQQQVFFENRFGERCQPIADDSRDEVMLARCNCFHSAPC